MVKILPADNNDIPVINSLAHSIWPVAYKDILSKAQMAYMLKLIYDPSSLQQQMLDQNHQFLILYFDDQPSGFASFSIKPGADDIYKLHKLYVLPNLQGTGLGRSLLNEVVALTKAAGGKLLQLNVNRNNKALRFYLKNDFKIMAEEDIAIGNGFFMNDYIMQRDV